MKNNLLIFLGLLFLTLSWSIAAEPIAVIVNKANTVDTLSLEELNEIYRGIRQNWKGSGKFIQPVNYPDDSEFKAAFYIKVLDTSPTEEFFLSGTPEPFKTSIRKSANSIKRFVSRFENAIGYVPQSVVDDSVKVVHTFELD